MDAAFLDVYFGQQIADSTITHSWLEMFKNFSPYFFAFIIILLFTFLLVYLLPLISRNPKSYYRRYKDIREEMYKIDELYSKKEISFEEYSFAQFNYAKEYENIVFFLSKYPEYKEKLQSYKIKETANREKEYNKIGEKDKIEKLNLADFLYDLLRSHAKYYTVGEIEQAILDEGFTNEIATLVINKMQKNKVNFASETKIEQNKVVNIINSLLSKNYENAPKKGEASSVDLIDLTKKRKNTFIEEKVTYEKYPTKIKEEKKETVLSSIKNLFKSKPKVHTVSEINDVFADIEKRLKENN